MSTARPVILVILDGFGINPRHEGNAIANAAMRNFAALVKTYPNARLSMSGADVGLPDGQMGNSEVGHMNIGAGRVVPQAARGQERAGVLTLLASPRRRGRRRRR